MTVFTRRGAVVVDGVDRPVAVGLHFEGETNPARLLHPEEGGESDRARETFSAV